ncbi:MAG: hypothetical protein R6V19_17915 [Armatimonadota bacterium]
MRFPVGLAFILLIAATGACAMLPEPRLYVVPLRVESPETTAGSMIAADVNNDGAMEILVTRPGYLGAYSTGGECLWERDVQICVGGSSEREGLPGHHGPGVQAADIDGDGQTEVLFLTRDSVVHVASGLSGADEWAASPPVPQGAEAWEHLVVANLTEAGDGDILLQATNAGGYRMGRYLAAFRLSDLQAGNFQPLWQTDRFVSCAHNGARVADLDGDGLDEILGVTILGPDGRVLCTMPVRGHLDSIYAVDVSPAVPGVEVVALEEGGGNRVFLCSRDRVLWISDHRGQEPQNGAVGRFAPHLEALQIWCRSRYSTHQKPFVFDHEGNLVAEWQMDDVAPEGWTDAGVEVIHTIDWTGEDLQLACAKERHTSGDVCIFNPMNGRFRLHIKEQADRLYVADLLGDWREEIVVWNSNELHIYENTMPNPAPDHPSLWDDHNYRRARQTWNYYSP